MARNATGFTLLEALVALAVVSALLAAAIPAWSAATATVQASNAKAALGDSLLRAVRHAGLTGAKVVLCPSTDGQACTGGHDWSHGWIGFSDLEGDRKRGPGDTLVLHEPPLPDDIRLLTSRGRSRVVFQPSGSNAGYNVTFTLCDRRGPEYASTAVLANTGRLKFRKATTQQAMACATTA